MPAGYGRAVPEPNGRSRTGRPCRSDAGRPTGGRGLGGQQVHHVVHPVPRVALDPLEGHRPGRIEGQGEQLLPQVLVGHRLPLGVAPAPALPPDPPLLAEAVDHVGRVADHVQRAGQGLQGADHRGDLHPLVGGVGLAPAVRRAAVHRPGPSPGPGVPQARPVGVDDGRRHAGRRWFGAHRDSMPDRRWPSGAAVPECLSRYDFPPDRRVGAWEGAVRRSEPPTSRRRSRRDRRSGSTPSTTSSTPTVAPGPATC